MKRRFVIILVLIFFVYFLQVMFKQQILLNQLNDEKNVYEDQIAQKKDEIESLKRELDKVKTPYYIEKLAREKLKMVMPDEIIFIIENN